MQSGVRFWRVKQTALLRATMSTKGADRTLSFFTRLSISHSRYDLASSIRSGLRYVPATPNSATECRLLTHKLLSLCGAC